MILIVIGKSQGVTTLWFLLFRRGFWTAFDKKWDWNCSFLPKNLRMSYKCSTFAPAFGSCPMGRTLNECTGKMAEWSIAAVLKTVDLRGSGGSNPSLSARLSLQERVQARLSERMKWKAWTRCRRQLVGFSGELQSKAESESLSFSQQEIPLFPQEIPFFPPFFLVNSRTKHDRYTIDIR